MWKNLVLVETTWCTVETFAIAVELVLKPRNGQPLKDHTVRSGLVTVQSMALVEIPLHGYGRVV